jgi:hypothetical protein
MLKNCITVDIEDSAECMLEEGAFEEALHEQLDLTNVFEHMQEQGIIKKNVNVKGLLDSYEIRDLVVEATSDVIWDFVRRQVKGIEPNFNMDVDSEFNCSLWR